MARVMEWVIRREKSNFPGRYTKVEGLLPAKLDNEVVSFFEEGAPEKILEHYYAFLRSYGVVDENGFIKGICENKIGGELVIFGSKQRDLQELIRASVLADIAHKRNYYVFLRNLDLEKSAYLDGGADLVAALKLDEVFSIEPLHLALTSYLKKLIEKRPPDIFEYFAPLSTENPVEFYEVIVYEKNKRKRLHAIYPCFLRGSDLLIFESRPRKAYRSSIRSILEELGVLSAGGRI